MSRHTRQPPFYPMAVYQGHHFVALSFIQEHRDETQHPQKIEATHPTSTEPSLSVIEKPKNGESV